MKSRISIYLGLVLGVAPGMASAQSSDRWLANEDTAQATLPAPRDAGNITSTTLSCAAQRWTLRLDLAPATDVVDGVGALDVDGRRFDIALAVDGSALDARVPREALDPLRTGIAMTIDLAGALELALGDPAFSLRGSRVAIDTIAGRCTLRDMSDYTPVTFTPYSSYMSLARELRQADIDAFAVSTASQPTLDAAMAEFGGDRRILFTRICGSSWYFGSSGCNIIGYAPDAAEPGWRPVYDTENVHLHTDPRSMTDGWPDIATLPVGAEGLARLWRWNGSGYDFAGELPEESDPLALRPSVD
jgi:hypothetical protein